MRYTCKMNSSSNLSFRRDHFGMPGPTQLIWDCLCLTHGVYVAKDIDYNDTIIHLRLYGAL